MVRTRAHAKGQRSLGSKVRVETDGRTDKRTQAIALPFMLMGTTQTDAGKRVERMIGNTGN